MPTDSPGGLINQHVVTSVKARKATKPAEPKKATSDDDTAASKSDKAK